MKPQLTQEQKLSQHKLNFFAFATMYLIILILEKIGQFLKFILPVFGG